MGKGIKPTTRYRKKDDSKKAPRRRAHGLRRQSSDRRGGQAVGQAAKSKVAVPNRQPWPGYHHTTDHAATLNITFGNPSLVSEEIHRNAAPYFNLDRPSSAPGYFGEPLNQSIALQDIGRNPGANYCNSWNDHIGDWQATASENDVEPYQYGPTCLF